MPSQSLDLTLDAAGDLAVRTRWQALEDLGIPSEGRRTSASHRPHLTLLETLALKSELLERAGTELRPLLPLRLYVGAAVVFARGPFVVAHLIAVPDALHAFVLGLRAEIGALDRVWRPHLTLSRKVPADRLDEALGAAARSRPDFVMTDGISLQLRASGTVNEHPGRINGGARSGIVSGDLLEHG